jgi:hypothetical protein
MYDPRANVSPIPLNLDVAFDHDLLEIPETWSRDDFADLLPEPAHYEELSQ